MFKKGLKGKTWNGKHHKVLIAKKTLKPLKGLALMCLMINLKRKKRKMIVLNKNSTTNFVATLYELSILSNPNYLFKFTSKAKLLYYNSRHKHE
jgi:hypothetical protein